MYLALVWNNLLQKHIKIQSGRIFGYPVATVCLFCDYLMSRDLCFKQWWFIIAPFLQQHYISTMQGVLMTAQLSLDLSLLCHHHSFGLFFNKKKKRHYVSSCNLCTFQAPLTDIWCVFTMCWFNLTSMYEWVMFLRSTTTCFLVNRKIALGSWNLERKDLCGIRVCLSNSIIIERDIELSVTFKQIELWLALCVTIDLSIHLDQFGDICP